MALDPAFVWEVRTVGSDTNGGGFKAGASGTDWSQQTSPQYSVTDGVTNGTTTITSATANFGTDVVGNAVYVSGGTGSVAADLYEIVSRTSATAIVVDRSTGLTAGTGVTLKIGGALGSPGWAASKMVPSNTVWIKAGTYPVTTTVAGAAGPIAYAPGADATIAAPSRIAGYNTTRGDNSDTRPLIQLQASLTTNPITVVTLSSGTNKFVIFENIDVDCNTGNTSATGVNTQTNYNIVRRCKIRRSAVLGLAMGDTAQRYSDIEVYDFSGTAGIAGVTPFPGYDNVLERVSVHDGSTIGIDGYQSTMHYRNVLIYNITGTTKDGIRLDYNGTLDGGTIYNCTGSGVKCIGRATALRTINNVISYGNAQFGFACEDGNTGMTYFRTCAGGANTSGDFDSNFGTATRPDFITLTADPFTDKANSDFTLNNAAGGGAALRGAGVPGSMGGLNIGYRDVGVLQHLAAVVLAVAAKIIFRHA